MLLLSGHVGLPHSKLEDRFSFGWLNGLVITSCPSSVYLEAIEDLFNLRSLHDYLFICEAKVGYIMVWRGASVYLSVPPLTFGCLME